MDGQTNDQLNTSITALLKVLKKNNDSYVDDFPIKITAGGKYYYTYDRQITKWLKKKGLSTDLTAKEAFKAMNTRAEPRSSFSIMRINGAP